MVCAETYVRLRVHVALTPRRDSARFLFKFIFSRAGVRGFAAYNVGLGNRQGLDPSGLRRD
jgi:hypothetical protein